MNSLNRRKCLDDLQKAATLNAELQRRRVAGSKTWHKHEEIADSIDTCLVILGDV